MNRLHACSCLALFLALASCTSTRTPSGYCENDCREVWTAECLSQCGIERPRDCSDDDDICEVGGMNGAGAGGAGAGGLDGGGSGRDGGGTGGSGGVVGNTGGTDGGSIPSDARVACDDSSDCDPQAPLCNAQGECEGCVNNAPCAARSDTPRCDTRSDSLSIGQCVRCTLDEHCDAEEVCEDTQCVECRSHDQCTDPEEPQCEAGECVPCSSSDACVGREQGATCDTDASSERRGECVQCVEHTDCDVLTPHCGSERTCEVCASDDPCMDRQDTPYCSTSGACVHCTAETEEEVCAGKACKLSTGTCTERDLASVGSCGACEADSECGPMRLCVPHEVSDVLEGTFCLFRAATAGCADADDDSRKPYSALTPAISLGGVGAPVCAPVTTCAMLDVESSTELVGIGEVCEDTNDCGDTRFDDDGFCNAQGRCTYSCTQDYECPSTGFSDCSGSSCRAP